MKTRFAEIKPTEFLTLAIILILNAFFLKFNAFRGLNFFDISAFTDASWRVYSGQKPYVDFMFVSGPVHLYLNAFFFFLFGIGKNAFLAHLIVVHSLAIIITFLISKKYLENYLTILTTLLTTACFYWPISHPWYDQTVHLFGLFALLTITYTIPFQNSKTAFRIGLFAGAMVAFSFMTKSNVGTAYGMLFAILFLVGNHKMSALSGLTIGSLVITALFLILIGVPELYIEQTLRTFSDDPNQKWRRIIPFLHTATWLQDWYWLPSLLILCSVAYWKALKAWVVLAIGIFVVSIFCAGTGSMKMTANIPLLGIFMTFVFIFFHEARPLMTGTASKKINQASTFICVAVTCLLIGISAKRGLALEAWTYGNLNPFGTYPLKTKSMEGWLAEEKTGEALDDLVQYINQKVSKTDSLLILTDLQILYALTGRESYKGIPFILMVPYEPPPGPRMERVRQQILTHPPDWIITHRDHTTTGMVDQIIPYMGLREFVINTYTPVASINNYAVLRKR